MKQLIKNYSFDKTAKTVTFTDFASISLDRVYLVTNVTSNTIIYQFNDNTLGGTVSTNVLSLTYNTASMANTDKLQIIYDSATGDPTYDSTPLASGAATAANQTNGNQLARITDGTTTASVQAIGSGQNALTTAGGYKEVSGLSAGSLNADLLGTTDVSAYKWMSLQLTAVASGGVITIQASNDNSNFFTQQINAVGGFAGGNNNNATGTGIFVFPVTSRYIRIRQTAWTSGTSTGVVEMYSQSPSFAGTVGLSQVSTLSVAASSATGSAVPANAFFMGVNGASGNLKALNTFANATDAANIDTALATGISVYNGSSMDRMRGASAASGTTGTGLLGAGVLGFDGTNYQRVKTDTSGNVNVTSASATGSAAPSTAFYLAGSRNTDGLLTGIMTSTWGQDTMATSNVGLETTSALMLYNGSTLDRTRSAGAIGDGGASTGMLATTSYLYNGTTYDRPRTANSASGTTGTGVAGSGVLGYDGTNYQRIKTDTSGNLIVSQQPSTTNGLTTYRNLDVQSTGVNIKSTAGKVYGWYIANNASSVRYVKLYNKATAPTVGTDTPVMTIAVPANAATNIEYSTGITFATGIGIGGVTGVADSSTGAPTANDIICNLFYA